MGYGNAVFFSPGTDRRLSSGFAPVPYHVLRSRDISAGAKVLYGILLSYAWQSKTCYPNQVTMARDAGCSVRNVQRWLAELEGAKLIAVHQRGLNQPNLYELLPIPDTTNLSHPDATNLSGQDTTNLSHEEDSAEIDSGEQQHIESESLGDRPACEVGLADPDAAAPPSDVLGDGVVTQTQPEVPTPDAAVLASLVAVGVAQPVAQALAAQYPPDVIRRQVKYLADRNPVDPAAMLVEAVRGNWPDPRLRRNRAPRRRVASQAAYKPSEVDWANEPPL